MKQYWHEVSNEEKREISNKADYAKFLLAQKIKTYYRPDWCRHEMALDLEEGCKALLAGRVYAPDHCLDCWNLIEMDNPKESEHDPLLDQVDVLEDVNPDDKQFDAPTLLKEPEDYRRFYADKPHCELVNKIIQLSRTCEWWYEQNESLHKSLENHHNSLKGHDKKIANLHKIISKQQLKIERQAENITTLLHLYTSGKRSKSHKKLREKYRALKAAYQSLKGSN